MGIFKLFGGDLEKSVCCCKPSIINQTTIVNSPNPKNFRILNHQSFGKFFLVEINYPDCINFEGNKILLYENSNISELEKLDSIDPHFSDKKNLSPIARFCPNNDGRALAVRVAKFLASNS